MPLEVTASPEGMLRTLVVTWNLPTYVNAPTVNYAVTYYAVTSLSGGGMSLTTGPDELTAIVSGLVPFTDYSITVQACSEEGCGPESEEITQKTLEEG